MTVHTVAHSLVLPACKCGRPHGHKGWCDFRAKRFPRWQQYRSTKLPDHNRKLAREKKGKAHSHQHRKHIADALIGIPKKADAATISQCKAKPLTIRRIYRSLRLALAGPVRFDRPLERAAVIDIMLLPHYWPDPAQMLILKERWLQERKYKIWHRYQHRLAKA